jgi:cytochrome c-type biogenesis protein CcmE
MPQKSTILIVSLLFITLAGSTLGCTFPFTLGTNPQSASFFLTVNEVLDNQERLVDDNIRISGVVIGDTITYDEASLTLSFDIAHVPGDMAEVEQQGGLEAVQKQAANDPQSPRLHVVYSGIQPEMLRHEAQAIMSGHLGADGVFYIDDNGLLLKCPTKYEQAAP